MNTSQTHPGLFRYLNTQNPDVRCGLADHLGRVALGKAGTSREDWDKLERELMQQYLLSGYVPGYLYPFFIDINRPEIRDLWEAYRRWAGIPYGGPVRDTERREFERQLAAMVVGEEAPEWKPSKPSG